MKWKKRSTFSISKNQTLACTILSSIILNTSCTPCAFEPKISCPPQTEWLEELPSPFPETKNREIFLGLRFAEQLDLYRAITCYKRADFLAQPKDRPEISYHLFEAYYLGGKWEEAIAIYEERLPDGEGLPCALQEDLFTLTYDAYIQAGRPAHAAALLEKINDLNPNRAATLQIYRTVTQADFCALYSSCITEPFISSYAREAKSETTARLFNALLPGAGYLYVGQKETALTALTINALFIWACYQLFHQGQTAAGLIAASLEAGWYIGGINGAGLAAREWNERLYEGKGKAFLVEKRAFPLLQLSHAF